jgi:flagellar biosynthesis protein FliR
MNPNIRVGVFFMCKEFPSGYLLPAKQKKVLNVAISGIINVTIKIDEQVKRRCKWTLMLCGCSSVTDSFELGFFNFCR